MNACMFFFVYCSANYTPGSERYGIKTSSTNQPTNTVSPATFYMFRYMHYSLLKDVEALSILGSYLQLRKTRGTTDPWVDTKTGGTLQQANLVNRWHHMHMLEIQPQSGTTCISKKFGHQMAPFALVRNLATKWCHLH